MDTSILPVIIGHRGASGHAPENTLPSMLKAKQLGVSWVEFDVMLSACGTPIILHDIKLNRTTNSKGRIVNFNCEQLATLDAGSWFSKEFAGVCIPTLEQMIECLKQNNLNAVVEIKPYPGQDVDTARETFKQFRRLWPQGLQKMIFASFSYVSLRTVRELCPRQALGYGLHNWDKQWQAIVGELDCASIHVNHWILTRKRIEQLKASGRRIFCYTVNNPGRAQKLFAWGIHGIFTDFPDRFSQYLYSNSRSELAKGSF